MCLGSTYDEFENRVNFANMTFPAGMSDIYIFEKDNPHLSINIFTHSDGQFFPVHSTNLNGETDKARVGVNLVQNTTIDMSSGELVDHFYPVTNLSKFTQKKYISKINGATSYGHNISCETCAQSFKPRTTKSRKNSFVLRNGEVHLGFTDLNISQAYIDHIFLCKQGLYII